MGWSLAKLVTQMAWGDAPMRDALRTISPLCLPTAFTAACVALGIDARDGLAAYAFNWAENQVAAALKAVPLGQVAGQQILRGLHRAVLDTVDEAEPVPRLTWINTSSPRR